MHEMLVRINPETREKFESYTGSHREVSKMFGFSSFAIRKVSLDEYRIVGHINRQGWFFNEEEIRKWFLTVDPAVAPSAGKMRLEKSVVINNMRITPSNLEEFVKNLREMLK